MSSKICYLNRERHNELIMCASAYIWCACDALPSLVFASSVLSDGSPYTGVAQAKILAGQTVKWGSRTISYYNPNDVYFALNPSKGHLGCRDLPRQTGLLLPCRSQSQLSAKVSLGGATVGC